MEQLHFNLMSDVCRWFQVFDIIKLRAFQSQNNALEFLNKKSSKKKNWKKRERKNKGKARKLSFSEKRSLIGGKGEK